MKKRSEKIAFCCLSIFILLPSLLGVLFAIDLHTIGQRLIYLLTSIMLYGCGLFVFPRRTYFYVAAAGFFFSAVEIVHLIVNQATTSLLFVVTIIKAEKGEFLELLSTYWIVVVLFFALWIAYFVINNRFISNQYLFKKPIRYIGMTIVVLYSIIVCVCLHLQPAHHLSDNIRHTDLQNSALVGAEKVCPINHILLCYNIFKINTNIHKQEQYLADFMFDTTSDAADDELICLLIGETSRYDHWQINGYQRPTSPLLSNRGEQIISFNSCFTVANLTTVSVPFLLSRATPQDKELYYKERSVVDAFHEAGWRTAWIACQSFNNDFLLRISNACDTSVYIIPNKEQAVDTILLPPLKNELRHQRRQLIVLHSLGCHFKYNARYTADFQRFVPDMTGMDLRSMFKEIEQTDQTNARDKTDLRVIKNLRTIITNSYDNAICFTDYFIDQVIQQLENTGRPCVLIYIGDHGENLLDDERNMFLHGTYNASLYEYHVPLFVYATTQWQERYPDRMAAMRNNTAKRTSTMSIFHSLLDMGSITYTNTDSTYCITSNKMKDRNIIYCLDANLNCTKLPEK